VSFLLLSIVVHLIVSTGLVFTLRAVFAQATSRGAFILACGLTFLVTFLTELLLLMVLVLPVGGYK
jgi:hypothetical protein